MAGGRGFEPQFTSPEPVVLPLDDPPTGTKIQKLKCEIQEAYSKTEKHNPSQAVRRKS